MQREGPTVDDGLDFVVDLARPDFTPAQIAGSPLPGTTPDLQRSNLAWRRRRILVRIRRAWL